MLQVSSKTFTVVHHTGPDDLRRLSASLRLAGLLPAPVIEMEPEFLAEGFEGRDPGVLAAYRDAGPSGNGHPVAYLPYILRRINFPLLFGPSSLGRFPCRQLVLYGYASNEEDQTPILDLFFSFLFKHHRTWHVAQVFDMVSNTPFAEYISRLSTSNGSYRPVKKAFDTLQVDLSGSFEQYLADRFNKKIRYNLKREVRLLEAAEPGRVVTKVYTSPDQAEDFLLNAERIAQKTYQLKLGFSTIHATPLDIKKLEFLARQEKLRCYILFIRDLPAAYCLGTIRWGEFSYDVIGYDPQFAKLNPGKVLLYNILEDLHQNRIVDRVNFGKGITDYKRLFATSNRQTLDANLYARRPYPQMLRMMTHAADSGYRFLHPLIKPWMPYIKRKFQSVTALAALYSGFHPIDFLNSLNL